VATGVSSVLGYEGATSGAVQLVFQEDSGDPMTALGELSANGAALLVAGVDRGSADSAARYAARSGAPVLLLSEASVITPNAFSMGATEDVEHHLLRARLEAVSGSEPVIVDSNDCSTEHQLTSGFPISDWRNAGAQAIMVLAGPRCAQALDEAVADAQFHPWIGLGLQASAAAPELRAKHTVITRSGHYPFLDLDSPLAAAFIEQFARPPRWFEALGHDVAQIALEVLSSLPEVRLRDAAEVETYHTSVRNALASYRGRRLWTSKDARFEKQQLTRTLDAMQIAPDVRSSK
jgi:hypothetical protein